MKDEAIGAWEAACWMGVHWTRPKRMADAGLISSRTVGGQSGREFTIYSSKDCEENFAAYEEEHRRSGGRPRTSLDLRIDVIEKMGKKDRAVIAFDDAVSVHEAAEILGVCWTRVPRLVAEGRVVGRILWSERAGASRLWILSRRSCVAWAKEVRRLEAEGKKLGRPRNSSVAK